jgi:WD40 repeat protein
MTGRRGLGRTFTFTHDRTISATGFDGHPGQLSPDGRLLAVGLKRNGIALMDAGSLRTLGPPLRETGGEVGSLSFSPDGRLLAATAKEGLLTVWDVRSRSRLDVPGRGRVRDTVGDVAFSPTGALARASDRSVRLLDVTTGARLGEIEVRGSSGLAFSADGSTIAAARGWAGGADVWEAATGKRIAAVESEPYTADWVAALSPDGRLLAVGGWGRDVRLVEIPTGKLVHRLDQAGTGAYTLEFSRDGRTLAVSGWENVASLWDVASGAQIGPRLTVGSRRTAMDLSRDGRRLLMTAGNGDGAVWDIDPASWVRRACAIANRTLTRQEWHEFLPGRGYAPACLP